MNASVPPPGFVPPPDGGGAAVPAPVLPPAQPPRRRFPRRLIGAGVGVVAAAIAAFLLLGNQSLDPIAQAATVSSNTPGYRIQMGFTITSADLGGPISGSASGIVDPPDHAASMSLGMDMSQVPQAAQTLGTPKLQMGMVLLGQDVYVKFPRALLDQLPTLGGKPWIEINVAKVGGLPGLSSLNNPSMTDPGDVLGELRSGAQGVTNLGEQVVNGVQTTHYQGELSLNRLLGNVPSSIRPILQQITKGEGISLDVWIDAHSLVRRVVTSFTLGTATGPALEETATADFSNYGPQTRPSPPPASQVTDGNSIAGLSG